MQGRKVVTGEFKKRRSVWGRIPRREGRREVQYIVSHLTSSFRGSPRAGARLHVVCISKSREKVDKGEGLSEKTYVYFGAH